MINPNRISGRITYHRLTARHYFNSIKKQYDNSNKKTKYPNIKTGNIE